MLTPRRRALVPFQRSPINEESDERIDLMRERIAGHARMRERDRRELARIQLDAVQRQQRESSELRRITRGSEDPDLLHFARLGLIADPDEIDRDFGWFFRNNPDVPETPQSDSTPENAP